MTPSAAETVIASRVIEPFEVRLEGMLRHAVAIGAVLVALLPDARGSSELIGWLPMWLLGMPLSAWWVLHRFSRDGRASRRRAGGARRLPQSQARRSVRGISRGSASAAA